MIKFQLGIPDIMILIIAVIGLFLAGFIIGYYNGVRSAEDEFIDRFPG